MDTFTNGASTASPPLGILSKRALRSPAVRWLFSVRLRHDELHEVAMFGDDFIHIREIDPSGRLHHLATIDGFDSPIRSGGIIGMEAKFTIHPPLAINDEDLIKVEENLKDKELKMVPPQFIVISTTNPPELRFIIASSRGDSPLTFHERIRPLPNLDERTLYQPGSLITVDPQSRAFAVTADAENLIVYRLKDLQDLAHTYTTDRANWDPVREEQIFKINGTILRMHFLTVENQHPNHVALVLVVGARNRIEIQWFIWDFGNGSGSMIDSLTNPHGRPHIHRLPSTYGTPQLLVPSQHSPSFVMVHHGHYVIASGAMEGSLTMTENIDFQLGSFTDPRYPAVSTKLPVWTGWSKGMKNAHWESSTKETFYIVREDGEMYVFIAEPTSTLSNSIGHFDGFVDQGFACCEPDTTLRKPYFMVSAGVMSPGEVKQIGNNGAPGPEYPSGRGEATRAFTVDRLDNWSPSKDMILSDLGQGSRVVGADQRSGIYMTAGRGPKHGAIVEINAGFAARINTHFTIEDFAQATAIWPVIDTFGSTFVFVSLPLETLLFHMTPDFGELSELAGLDEPTLLVTTTPSGHVVQVTKTRILVKESNGDELHEVTDLQGSVPTGSQIISATCGCASRSILLALHHASRFAIRTVTLTGPSEDDNTAGELIDLPGEPTALLLFECHGATFAATSTSDKSLHIFRVEQRSQMVHELRHALPSICESLSIITNPAQKGAFTILCGMRDGSMVVLNIVTSHGNDELPDASEGGSSSSNPTLTGSRLTLKSSSTHNIGLTPVSLITHSDESTSRSYAICGTAIVQVGLTEDSNSLAFTEVILTPQLRVSKTDSPIRALAPFASARSDNSFANSLGIISGDICMIATLDDQVKAVPLNLKLDTSTPDHVLFCERLSAFIVASTWIKLDRGFPPRSEWLGKRMTYAQIEIISTVQPPEDDDEPIQRPTFRLWPSEKICGMLDLKFRDPFNGRKHAQLIVATSLPERSRYTSPDGDGKKGRLIYLNLKKDEEGNVDIVPTKVKQYDAPVTSIAAYSEREFVIATGLDLMVLRLIANDSGSTRWITLCRHELRSSAVHITTEAPYIHVSTIEDSLAVFELTEDPAPEAMQGGNDSGDTGSHTRPQAKLSLVFTDSQAKDVIHHLPISLNTPTRRSSQDEMDVDRFADEPASRANLVLVSTRHSTLSGLCIPPSATQTTAMPTVFEAELPRSLMRIRQGPVRPPWRKVPENTPGMRSVLADDLLGVSIDGELYQFSILDERAWKVLKVVEGLARLKDTLRLKEAGRFLYDDEDDVGAMMSDDVGGIDDKTKYHVDGDLLARYITNRAEMLDLVRLMQHDRYHGPDEQVFAEAVRELLGLADGVQGEALLEQLYVWYTWVTAPLL